MAASTQIPDSVMIFGCGYVGTALARSLLADGVRVGALTRNEAQAAELRGLGLHEVLVAELDSRSWHGQLAGSYNAVVNCVSSAGDGLDGYRKSYLEGQRSIMEWANGQSIESYVYTSSTSVYAQDGGVVVSETVDTADAPLTGQVLLQSEELLHEFSANWYVLRLAGIYGPGRHYLLDQLREGAGNIPGRGDYTLNMIHRDDIVSAIQSALSGCAPSGIYNIADDAPAHKAEVLAYLAERLNLPVPTFQPDQVSERLRRRGGRMPDRIISNAKAKELLRWQPKYPSYREGYEALV